MNNLELRTAIKNALSLRGEVTNVEMLRLDPPPTSSSRLNVEAVDPSGDIRVFTITITEN